MKLINFCGDLTDILASKNHWLYLVSDQAWNKAQNCVNLQQPLDMCESQLSAKFESRAVIQDYRMTSNHSNGFQCLEPCRVAIRYSVLDP